MFIWLMLNYLLKFFWGTRAMDVVFGFLVFLFIFFIATEFNLPVIKKLMLHVVNIAAIAVFIIFQPEIRLALSKIKIRGRKYRVISEADPFISEFSACVYSFSERQIGALFVLENQESYESIVLSSISLNANFSAELLEAIFHPSSPLHDGAVIIKGTTIISAKAILPLSHDTSQLSASMGTRHRAALGASQKCDAIVVMVSEETGKVSISRNGILTRGIKIDRFKAILRSVFFNEHPRKFFNSFLG
ncbi:diadenylate cyclase CdaA [Candidatus Clavichlamydia salmonicola]|uniref:diadenylate cyclase CdaA n=1 Tax=Candidatus Clavichlamydia salmonicola TaxID=469812 RepID=UPI001891A4B6|nr:diadenylate cyclase CdaA [Candidatus Clavichlamydia salmonicola]